jgi:hypothetical protein
MTETKATATAAIVVGAIAVILSLAVSAVWIYLAWLVVKALLKYLST